MRTTLDLSDALLRGAKRRAAEEGRTLTSVIEEALRDSLVPGVDVADRSASYDRMERDV